MIIRKIREDGEVLEIPYQEYDGETKVIQQNGSSRIGWAVVGEHKNNMLCIVMYDTGAVEMHDVDLCFPM